MPIGIRDCGRPIDWQRVRRIFGYPKPPRKIVERQFDYFDDELEALAKTPYEQINFDDLWYYHHDLAYVELQPDLFAYLFPVCLMDWHLTLTKNEPCSHGDSEFHYGVKKGNVFEKMLTKGQRDEVCLFFCDSFLDRIDAERGFSYSGMGTPAYGWMYRLNSLGLVMPRIDLLWNRWWSIESCGRAVAALQYCSAFMYEEGENPLFGTWTEEEGGGGPHIWECDSNIYDSGWMTTNVGFLEDTLCVDFLAERMQIAACKLVGEPEEARARQLVSHFSERTDLIAARTAELPQMLSQSEFVDGWTV